ncbi:hypothetical protein CapIbe_017464 [Capra ibex]
MESKGLPYGFPEQGIFQVSAPSALSWIPQEWHCLEAYRKTADTGDAHRSGEKQLLRTLHPLLFYEFRRGHSQPAACERQFLGFGSGRRQI